MKNARIKAALAAAALVLAAAPGAMAEDVRAEGVIEPARVHTLLAPYSGRVEDFTVRAGDVLAAGETLFAIDAAEVYAEFGGTVTGVFAQAGDSAEGVTERYGALLYIERDEAFRAECATSDNSGDNEKRIAHIGETVYIRGRENRDREGVARVIAASGRNYTIEVTEYDKLRVGDSVDVFRSEDYDSDTRLGTGKLTRVDPAAVGGEGYVLSVNVQDGQRVERGDVLLTLVPDALNGMQGGDGTVRMPVDGVVLSVSAQSGAQIAKDAPMATYCEAGDVQLVCAVDEDDIGAFSVGQTVRMTADGDAQDVRMGKVTAIAGASGEDGRFDVTIAPDDTQGLRIGMGMTAEPFVIGY